MSLPKKDRKVRSKSGKTFPDGDAPTGEMPRYAAAIAEALQLGFGGTHAAVKQVVALTGSNERAVKNWFSAKNGPSGENLILLMTHSDPVLESVLRMTGRVDLVEAKKLVDAKQRLAEVHAAIDEILRSD
jgi:hypothetical protein